MRYEDHIGLWKRELSNWLPNQIFDAHTHLSPPGIMRQLTAARLREPLTTFTSNTWHQLTEAYANVFNGKEVLGVIGFPFPLREVDIARANDYIVDLMCSESRLRGFILAHPEDSQETIRQFNKAEKRGVRFAGVKPYFDLLGKSNYATRMPEFIPEGLLDFMNFERLVLMLHTSSIGMADPEDQDYVRTLATKYPEIKVVLAHLGRYLQVEQFLSFMETDIPNYPSIFLEMSSASRVEAYERILREEKYWPKLLFGTDFPFGLITGVEHWTPETGPIFVTRTAYAWSDPDIQARFSGLRDQLTYNTYHVLEAFKNAMDQVGIRGAEGEAVKNKVFCENARNLFFPCG